MRLARLSLCAVLVVAVGCGDSDPDHSAGTIVRPGQSIQAAIDAAAAGDTITVLPGDYREARAGLAAVRITKPLKLIAQSTQPGARVRILPSPGQRNGILIEPAAVGDPDVDGVEVNGFTVEGFQNNGIWLRHVKNFTIENNEAINNLENGIWPTLSANGLVKKNVAYGSLDAALWVEASENVRVIENDLHHSPTGFEITVSNEIHAEGNNIHDNTIGVGLYHPAGAGLPPLLPLVRNGFWRIVNNHVHNNNQPNTAPPGGMAAALPPGGGILLLGVDNVTIEGNRVENNNFFGIGLIDYCFAVDGTDFSCSASPPAVRDTSPEFNKFLNNISINNAANPPPGPFQGAAADLLGVGGRNNCASGNTFGTSALQPPWPEC